MELLEALAFVLLPVFLVVFFAGRNAGLKKVSMAISGETFTVEVADTWFARMRGLQNRTGIGPNEGMLFVFPREGRPSFWMKDVEFPLDIVFLDKDKTIVEVFEKLPPCMSPFCRTYRPSSKIKYALELPAGTAERLGIKPGASFR